MRPTSRLTQHQQEASQEFEIRTGPHKGVIDKCVDAYGKLSLPRELAEAMSYLCPSGAAMYLSLRGYTPCRIELSPLSTAGARQRKLTDFDTMIMIISHLDP